MTSLSVRPGRWISELVGRSHGGISRGCAVLMLLPAANATAQHVITVDDSGGSDFTALQLAIDAAAQGDVLLVRSGYYGGPFLIRAKSLTIQADEGATVRLGNEAWTSPATLRIADLSGSQAVRIAGLVLAGEGFFLDGVALELENNDGVVWVQDCVVNAPGVSLLGRGVAVLDSLNVVVIGSDVHGSSIWYPCDDLDGAAPAGLTLSGGSWVHAYDCGFFGARGDGCTMPGFVRARPGGAGVLLAGSGDSLFLSGCEVRAGAGIHVSNLEGSDCSEGGIGLESHGQAVVLDSVLAGGVHGCSPTIAPASSGGRTFLGGSALHFSATTPVREGEPIELTFDGPPDVPVYLLWSAKPFAQFRPANLGSLLLGLPRQLVFIGTTDSSGHLSRTAGPLNAIEVRTLFAQAIFQQGGLRLGPASMMLVLDESF